MKMKSVVLLVVAVGCGLVAMLGVQQVLSGNKSGKVKVGKVLVAIAEIPPGTPLNEENTAFKEMPLESIPEGAVTDPTEIVEKALKSAAVPGEFIMLAKIGSDTGASFDIPVGMRVFTTAVNLTKTHSGLIRPGDRVDILLAYKVRSGDRGMTNKSKIILEYIEIFATDSILLSQDQGDSTEINAKNLSFLVTPEQGQILNFAVSKGELTLALRNGRDEEHVDVAIIDDSFLEEGGSSSFGEAREEDGEAGPMYNGEEEGDGGIRAAVAGELAETTDDEPEVADVPTWKVVIYSGEDVLEQEVPLPLDDNGMTEEEAAMAEREAQLAEREAELDAREAEMDKQNTSVDGSKEDGSAIDTDAETQPTAAKKTEAGKVWKGMMKKFLTGA